MIGMMTYDDGYDDDDDGHDDGLGMMMIMAMM